MKKNTSILWSALLLLAAACTQKPSVPANEFLIEGKLQNVPDSAVIELRILDGQLLKLITQDTVIDGRFTLRDTLSGGNKQLLLMSSSKGFPGTWQNVWVASGKYIKVQGADKLLRTWKIESDIAEQAEENRFLEALFPEEKDLLEYKAQEYDLLRDMYMNHPDDEAYHKVGWVKVDSLRKLEEPLQEKINKKELDYLKVAPVTQVWMEKFLQHASRLQWDKKYPYIPQVKELYARLSEADKQTEVGQSISEYMNLGAEVNVGDDMVDGDLYDPEGNLHHLSEYAGRYIMLDFWSRGCSPCIQSIPEVEKIAEMYKDKLAVISISGDAKEDWKQCLADRKMTGIQWNELRKGRTGLAARYQAIGIPHYVLISPESKVIAIWSGYGPGSLKAKLKEMIP